MSSHGSIFWLWCLLHAISQSHDLNPVPPQQPHTQHSTHIPHILRLALPSCAQNRTRNAQLCNLQPKSNTPLDLSIRGSHHHMYHIYSVLHAPITLPANDLHHRPILSAAHLAFGLGVKIPTPSQSLRLHLPPPHMLHRLHPMCSHHTPRQRSVSQTNTECSAFGIRFRGENSHPHPNSPSPSPTIAYATSIPPYIIPSHSL